MKETPGEITFKFESHKTLDYSYETPSRTLPKNANTKFSFSSGIRINHNTNTIYIMISVELIWDKKKSPEVIGRIRTLSSFKIVKPQIILNEKNQIQLPINFVKLIIGLAFSTTRGTFSAWTRGTVLDRYVFPVIDPAILVPKLDK